MAEEFIPNPDDSVFYREERMPDGRVTVTERKRDGREARQVREVSDARD